MKRNIFFLLVLLLSTVAKAQLIVEGVISKGVFKDAIVFFEKSKTTDPASLSGLTSTIYIVYNDGKREEILPNYFLYVEQFNYHNDTLSFIVTIMSGDRFYVLMTKINQKWTVINSGFVANFDNLPQVIYNVKSLTIVDLYYIIIEYNPKFKQPVELLYFHPQNGMIDIYELTTKENNEKNIISINGNFYKLTKANTFIPKLW